MLLISLLTFEISNAIWTKGYFKTTGIWFMDNTLVRIKICISVFLLNCMLQGTGNATPVINGIQVTPNTDSDNFQIRVTGTGFGSGPNVVYYNNFNQFPSNTNIDNTIDTPRINFPGSTNISGSTGPKVTVYKGKKGFEVVNEATDVASILRIDLAGFYSEIFLAYAVTVPNGSTPPASTEAETFFNGSAWKFSWIMQTTQAYHTEAEFDLCVPTQVGSTAYLAGNSNNVVKVGTGYPHILARLSNWWEWGDFNFINLHLKKNTVDFSILDAEFTTLNRSFGFQEHPLDPGLVYLKGPEPSFSKVNIPGWTRNTDSDNFQAIYDDVYIAAGPNASARIEITDNSNYPDSNIRMVVPAFSWTNTEVKFDLPKDSSIVPVYYVHIFDSSGAKVLNGFRLCDACPKPPVVVVD